MMPMSVPNENIPKQCEQCTFYAHPELMDIHVATYHGAQPPTDQDKENARISIRAIGFNEQQSIDIVASMDEHNV